MNCPNVIIGESISTICSMSSTRFSQVLRLLRRLVSSRCRSSWAVSNLTGSCVSALSRLSSFIGLIDGFSKSLIWCFKGLGYFSALSPETALVARRLFLLLLFNFCARFSGLITRNLPPLQAQTHPVRRGYARARAESEEAVPGAQLILPGSTSSTNCYGYTVFVSGTGLVVCAKR